jgi:hypothetical protein
VVYAAGLSELVVAEEEVSCCGSISLETNGIAALHPLEKNGAAVLHPSKTNGAAALHPLEVIGAAGGIASSRPVGGRGRRVVAHRACRGGAVGHGGRGSGCVVVAGRILVHGLCG